MSIPKEVKLGFGLAAGFFAFALLVSFIDSALRKTERK